MSGSAYMQRTFPFDATIGSGRAALGNSAAALWRLMTAVLWALVRPRNDTIAVGRLSDAMLRDIGLTRADIDLAARGTPLEQIRASHALD